MEERRIKVDRRRYTLTIPCKSAKARTLRAQTVNERVRDDGTCLRRDISQHRRTRRMRVSGLNQPEALGCRRKPQALHMHREQRRLRIRGIQRTIGGSYGLADRRRNQNRSCGHQPFASPGEPVHPAVRRTERGRRGQARRCHKKPRIELRGPSRQHLERQEHKRFC